MSWGEPGTDPGQFNIAHNVCCDPDGFVFVADRENHRVQVFDGNGKYEGQWNNMHRPSGLYLEPGKQGRMYIGEIGPDMAVNIELPGCGPRVSIYTHDGKLLARLGHEHAGLEYGPVHLSARDQRRLAWRHLCRRGQLHQLGSPRPRQGRADPAGPQEPPEARQGGLSTMGKTPMRGMVMGSIAVVLGLLNLSTGGEAPSASVQLLTYVLLGLGAIGFVGSLILYLKQKAS